jgi:predicted ATPase
MWSLLEGDALLLLEEPELSLNETIVRQIPPLIWQMQRKAKHRRQVFVTTHSAALLEHPSIEAREVLRLEPSADGTRVLAASEEETQLVEAGYTVAEAIASKVSPNVAQLELF